MHILLRSALILTFLQPGLYALTSNPSSSVYSVTEGVSFSVANSGASNFLFSWTDSNGSFGSFADPTLILTAGQTYTFARTSSAHPFFIADSSLPVSGTDGAYIRATTDITVVNNSLLGGPSDLETFMADPAPTSDLITWTPTVSESGNYYYSCYVMGHSGMTGRIEVVPEPSTTALMMSAAILALVFFRRHFRA